MTRAARAALLVLALGAAPVVAQWRRVAVEPNLPYDGRFTTNGGWWDDSILR